MKNEKAIVNDKQKKPLENERPTCAICKDEKGDYELENGNFICDNCAQIIGELAE